MSARPTNRYVVSRRGMAWMVALAAASSATVSCSTNTVIDPASLAQRTPIADAGDELDEPTGCQRLPATTNGAGSCLIGWSCVDSGALRFICITDDGGSGCACLVDEDLLDASTTQVIACDDEDTLAAQARATCGWRVP